MERDNENTGKGMRGKVEVGGDGEKEDGKGVKV